MRVRPLAVAALSLLALRCAPASEEDIDSDEAAHTARSPIHDNAPFFWADTDYATFKQIAQAPPFRTGAPLAGDHPITARLQAWADAMDARVRADVKKKTRKDLVAPKPILRVVPAADANAWVSGVPACFTAEADLSAIGTPGRAARNVNLAFIANDNVKEAFSMFGAPPPTCATPTNWGSTAEAIAFFNATGAKCRVEPDGARVKVVGEGCSLAGTTAATTASKLTFYAASPYVHFTTAMIAAAADERGIAGIVAHELAHYYRSHAVSDLVMGKYNHWYDQRTVPAREAPEPSADSAALEAQFRRTMPYPMPKVPGQQISYRLTDVLVDGFARLLEEANGPACADAVSKLGEWRTDFAGFGSSYVKKSTQASYLVYETALLACAGRVNVAALGAAGGAGELTLDLARVRDAIRSGANAFAEPPVEAGTLADLIATLQARANVLDVDENQLLDAMRARRLGRYTAEQEADDFSLEYFTRVGQPASSRIDTYFDLIKGRAYGDPDAFEARNGGLTLDACEGLYRAGWKETVNGVAQAAFIPLGNLHDPHHGDCFRIFNMTQEQRAHRYRTSGAGPRFTEDWASIQAEAQQITDAFRPSGPLPSHMPQRGGSGAGSIIVDGF